MVVKKTGRDSFQIGVSTNVNAGDIRATDPPFRKRGHREELRGCY